MKKNNTLLKKSMTKKQYISEMKKQRSSVGQGQNLGTRVMKSNSDYSRQKSKNELRKIISDY